MTITYANYCNSHSLPVELQDVFESDAFIFLVFELCKNGELFDYLTSVVTLSEKKTRYIMRCEVILAVYLPNLLTTDSVSGKCLRGWRTFMPTI